ncbi:MAG: AMP-binding protein [Ilumatobacteraceae bacterium]
MTLVHQLLAGCAEADPDRCAVVEDDRTFTYRELAERAHQLARSLRACGVRPGDRVGVGLEPGWHAVVSLFGIVEAGAVYVPLGTAPPDRRRVVAADADLRAIVEPDPGAAPGAPPAVRHGATGIALLDDAVSRWLSWDEVERQAPHMLPTTRRSDDIASIFYTSGSTGTPKGVAHDHSSWCSFVDWAAAAIVDDRDARVAATAALTFDISLLEIVVPIARRASIVVLPRRLAAFPAAFAAALERAAPTVLQLVPTMWRMVLHSPAALASVRVGVVTGERLAPKDWAVLRSVVPDTRLLNVYGSTEVNDCAAYELPATWDPSADVPIGTAVPTTCIALIGPDDAPVPDGHVGELVVAGPMVMRGYWNRDADTASRVVRLPDGASAFRTGDLARRAPDGELRLEGRRSRTVKVRGEWVNLGDVEAVALDHPAIVAAVALAAEAEGPGNIVRLLVTTNAPVDAAELVRHCGRRLPRPARPQLVDVVEELPMNANGKIDLARLTGAGPTTGDVHDQ